MQSNVKFVTDGSKVYHLAGNNWYAVMEDADRVMLVDTDCKVGDEELKTPWSNGDYRSEDGKNGQCILDYVNNIANKYFSSIKYAIVPRNVEAGTGKIESTYMWPMSKEEFDGNKVVNKKIAESSNSFVWTRTFRGINSYNSRYAWCVDNSGGGLNSDYVGGVFRVAPAFNLKKSAIEHITEDGEIVLKPVDVKMFVTDGRRTYHLGGNSWYAVEEDEDKVMLVDTDCKIADEELESPWSDDSENGQCIFDYCNNLVDKYFSKIKHAIIPRTAETCIDEFENVLMWPMSFEEFAGNRRVGSKIFNNTRCFIWSRTFYDSKNERHYAWYVNCLSGDLYGGGNVCNLFRVAPAFYLKKSAIERVSQRGVIVLRSKKTCSEDNII